MTYKADDWISHSKFGTGKVLDVDGAKLTVRFLNSGERKVMESPLIQLTTKPANEPVLTKAKRTSRKSSNGAPAAKYTLDQLIATFNSNYPGGFESQKFMNEERNYKYKACEMLRAELSEQRLSELLREGQYATIAELAKRVVRKTNLIFPMEKAKFTDALRTSANQELFSRALFDLLYGNEDAEKRFEAFVDVLATIGACKWTIATYFQFLQTRGGQMFMKPRYAQAIADSLGMSLNYKTDPTWLAYESLHAVSKKLESELRMRGLPPESGVDVQGFMYCSVRLADRLVGRAT